MLTRGVEEIAKVIYIICLAWLPEMPTVEDTTHFGHRTWRNRGRIDLEASFQRTRSQLAMQAAKREKQPIVLPNYKAHELQH